MTIYHQNYRKKIFKEVFELSEIAKYDRNNRDIYEESLKAKRDWKNSLDTSFFKGLEAGKLQGIEVGIEKGIEVGIEKGIEKNKLEMAKNAKAMGLNISDIIKLTGLPKEQIERL